MHALLTKAAIARRLDVDPRTLNGILERGGIKPEFVQGARNLFPARIVKMLRGQIGEAMR